MFDLNSEQLQWCADHYGEAISLLKQLGKIPAASYHENRRAEFIRKWLNGNGADSAYIDRVGNVVLEMGDIENKPISVIMAHMDVVFPDTEELPMREEGGRLYAPGIGDDTANLVNLLLAVKYILEKRPDVQTGLVIAANVCEEGLGNLRGSGEIVRRYGVRMSKLITLDVHLGQMAGRAVGSHRYKITVHAKGGHSYYDFGNENAILQAAQIVTALYRKQVPNGSKTTYNVGVISGGSTVNSICEECSLLYEYRSEDRMCLREMQEYFESVISEARTRGIRVDTERIGDRPCADGVDPIREQVLENDMADLVGKYFGQRPETGTAMSTDCNSALAKGIPSVCIGTVTGGGMHTRDEWIDMPSMVTGMKIALGALLYCCGI